MKAERARFPTERGGRARPESSRFDSLGQSERAFEAHTPRPLAGGNQRADDPQPSLLITEKNASLILCLAHEWKRKKNGPKDEKLFFFALLNQPIQFLLELIRKKLIVLLLVEMERLKRFFLIPLF